MQLFISVWASVAKEPLSMSHLQRTHGHRSPVCMCVHTHTQFQNKQDSLSPMYRPIHVLHTAQGSSLYSTGRRCLKKPSLCPTNCKAPVWDDPATLSTWPYHLLHPLCHKECWNNVLLSVKIAYFAMTQELFTTEKMKRDLTDSTTKLQLLRRIHTNYKVTVTCTGWAERRKWKRRGSSSHPRSPRNSVAEP